MLSAQRPAPKFSRRDRPLSTAAAGPGDRVWWLLAQAQDFHHQAEATAAPANAQAQSQTQAQTAGPQTRPLAGKQN
ncbi:hypothetical protein KVR01_006334 [Diaporthe batatas]|uniref:uncharacterized protein n=1 Tax=Diaporthe batatas TaxID=748121 RepID=UPI001D03FD06|nr:uncharacterized protein KVR01_006334 [Diaporthe batatas]KAG8164416.1 hypothetical protein KVR01_006334 [Diaporthe batatas]